MNTDKLIDNTNFRIFRKLLGLNQSQLATTLKSNQQTINMIEHNKRQVPPSVRETLFKVYGVSYDLLLKCQSEEDIKKLLENAKKAVVSDDNLVAIPLYSAVASAGYGEKLQDYPEQDKIYFDKRWLENIIGIQSTNASLIQARGDSMDSGENKPSDIRDGDLLLVDNSQLTPINNQIYVFREDTQLFVKKITTNWDGSYLIVSQNVKYQDRVPNSSTRILGRVVWNGNKNTL